MALCFMLHPLDVASQSVMIKKSGVVQQQFIADRTKFQDDSSA